MPTRQLVRYVSPFGSPAWMTREAAQRHLDHDDARYERLRSIEDATGTVVLSDSQRRIGPPRIEYVR